MDPSINPIVGMVLVVAICVAFSVSLWGVKRTTEIIENEETENTGVAPLIALLSAAVIIAAVWIDQSMK